MAAAGKERLRGPPRGCVTAGRGAGVGVTPTFPLGPKASFVNFP